MMIGCDGKTFYTDFRCRYDDEVYEARVTVNKSDDTPETVAKKLQSRMNEIELEVMRRDIRDFSFFKREEDNGTVSECRFNL